MPAGLDGKLASDDDVLRAHVAYQDPRVRHMGKGVLRRRHPQRSRRNYHKSHVVGHYDDVGHVMASWMKEAKWFPSEATCAKSPQEAEGRELLISTQSLKITQLGSVLQCWRFPSVVDLP